MSTSPKTATSSAQTYSQLDAKERRELGRSRVQHAAYDGIMELWRARQEKGCSKLDIAEALERHPSWVTRALAGPANWTLGTLGELAVALDGMVEIRVLDRDRLVPANYDVYEDLIHGTSHVVCPLTPFRPGSTNITVGSRSTTDLKTKVHLATGENV